MAGKDLLAGFIKRHPQLSIWKSETNISKAVGVNSAQLATFFHAQVLAKGNSSPRHIWNMDETGISNVQKPVIIVAT